MIISSRDIISISPETSQFENSIVALLIIFPSPGKANDIDNVLKPVKVPSSKIFLTLHTFINK